MTSFRVAQVAATWVDLVYKKPLFAGKTEYEGSTGNKGEPTFTGRASGTREDNPLHHHAPQGHYNIARGNAPGSEDKPTFALQGQNNRPRKHVFNK